VESLENTTATWFISCRGRRRGGGHHIGPKVFAGLKKRRGELLRAKNLSAEGQKLLALKQNLTDTSQVPITQLRLIRGRVGYLTEPVTVSYVVDEQNFVGRWARLTMWVSDTDTKGLKNGMIKKSPCPCVSLG